MSLLVLQVDEALRTLSVADSANFVEKDKNVDIVRFILPSGFSDIPLDEATAVRVMYIRPGETQVRGKTIDYVGTDGVSHFYDWYLLSADLAKKGPLTIALCVLRTEDEVEAWHTVPYLLTIHRTVHTDDSDEADETITPTLAERVAILEALTQRTRGMGTFKVTTAPTAYSEQVGNFTPVYRIALEDVLMQSGLSEVIPGDVLEYGYYHYAVGYVDDTYVYLGARQSIRGAAGDKGADGKDGEDAILLKIDSSKGTVFKNNRVETILTVTIFYGSQKIEDIESLRGAFGQTARLEWEWLRLGDETYGTIASTDSRLLRDGFSFVLTPDDVDVKVTFRCNLVV